MKEMKLNINQVTSGTSKDNENDKAAMRFSIEKKKSDNNLENNESPERKYGNSTPDEDEHPERNPGVGQVGTNQ